MNEQKNSFNTESNGSIYIQTIVCSLQHPIPSVSMLHNEKLAVGLETRLVSMHLEEKIILITH